MAIQVSGTQVIGNSRELTNIASVDATTAASITAAGVGGGGLPFSWYKGKYVGMNPGSPGGYLAWDSSSTNAMVMDPYCSYRLSTDGSVNWSATTYYLLQNAGATSGLRGLVGDPTATNVYVAAASSGTAGIYRTTNPTSSWSRVYTGIVPSCLAVSPDGSKWVAGSYPNGNDINVAYSSNGSSWNKSSNITNDGRFARGIDVADNGTVIVVDSPNIWRSTNSGASFTKITGITGSFLDVRTDNDGTWVTCGAGQVWRSTNDGVTWTQVKWYQNLTYEEMEYGGGTFIVNSTGSGARAPLYSQDGGESWATTIPVEQGLDWMGRSFWQPSNGQWFGLKEFNLTELYMGIVTNE